MQQSLQHVDSSFSPLKCNCISKCSVPCDNGNRCYTKSAQKWDIIGIKTTGKGRFQQIIQKVHWAVVVFDFVLTHHGIRVCFGLTLKGRIRARPGVCNEDEVFTWINWWMGYSNKPKHTRRTSMSENSRSAPSFGVKAASAQTAAQPDLPPAHE